MTLRNDWSGGKHRFLASYDATSLGVGEKGKGFISAVQDFDNDKTSFAVSDKKQYVEEPLSTLPQRLRINFWKNLDPNLSPDDVPALTPQQRQRLGQEMRAVIAPFTKKYVKTYFRELPEKRTIMGMATHGYRMTALIDTSAGKGSAWTKFAAEWWLAEAQPGDEEIKGFIQKAIDFKQKSGGPTVSMWLNEAMPVLWEAFPKDVLQSVQSVMGNPNAPEFRGTPVQMFVTVSPPPAERAFGGDARFTLELKKRETVALDAATFAPPAGFQRQELEPELKKLRDMIEMGEKKAQEMMP